MRRATPAEQARWDELVAANPDRGNPLQVRAYGQFKQHYGWRPEYILHELGGVNIATLYLVRAVPGLGELWYAPKGPGVTSPAQLQAVLHDFHAPRAFMLKVEPDLPATTSRAELEKFGLIKAKFDLQMNRSTVIVDLRPPETDILAGFKQKTRYNIRLAERRGVVVSPAGLTHQTARQMYQLLQATQARAGFYLRPEAYFTKLWQHYAAAGQGQLFFASYQDEIIAGIFVLYAAGKGLYKDGGSTRTHSELQAPYLLQWEGMRWLKAHGCDEYDLHGVPPSDHLDDRTHPLAGLAQFKTGFNPGVITEYIGVYDLPIKAAKYRLWRRLGEKLIAGYSLRVKGELFY